MEAATQQLSGNGLKMKQPVIKEGRMKACFWTDSMERASRRSSGIEGFVVRIFTGSLIITTISCLHVSENSEVRSENQ